MARIDSRLDTILTAIVVRLAAQLDGIDANNCYLAIDDGEIAPSAGDFVCVVSPASGQFDEGYLHGGGVSQASDFFEFDVTVYSTVQLDESYRDPVKLTDSTLGLIQKHYQTLLALTTHDLLSGSDNILRDPILPMSYSFGRSGRGLSFVKQTFRLAFDWDLTP